VERPAVTPAADNAVSRAHHPVAVEPPAAGRADQVPHVLGGLPIPSTVPGFLLYLLASWAAVLLVAILLPLFSLWLAPVSVLLVAGASYIALQQAYRLVRARERVLTAKDVPILWGMVRLIAWDPTEGVLILRDKSVHFSDDDLHDGRGGIRFLLPAMGEELALRVPLEVQSLHFSDADVLTREYLTLTVRGTMKWRIVDIRKFYLLVSRELRYTSDRSDGHRPPASAAVGSPPAAVTATSTIEQLKEAAVAWLRWMAEHETRAVLSRVSSGLLVAEQVASEMPEFRGGYSQPSGSLATSPEFGSATDGLAAAIHGTIAARVGDYGIAIQEVTLQEIRLPQEIHRQCIEACRAAYLPLLAQREHAGKRVALQTEVELLGRDAVATSRIVGSAPALGLSDFLNQFLVQRMKAVGNGSPGTALDAAVAARALRNLPDEVPNANRTSDG
jgi:regulator of protease activity HflC (stomatin/prohibitin superfamily)